jgi:hypothetical protein
VPDHETDRLFVSELCGLARDKLKQQTARTGALDTNTVGVMALDVGLGAIVLSSGRTSLWVAALTVLCLSLTLAAGALSLRGAELTGPSTARLRREGSGGSEPSGEIRSPMIKSLREGGEGGGRCATIDDAELLQLMLDGLEWDARANDRANAPKNMLYRAALTLLMSGFVLELAGRL